MHLFVWRCLCVTDLIASNTHYTLWRKHGWQEETLMAASPIRSPSPSRSSPGHPCTPARMVLHSSTCRLPRLACHGSHAHSSTCTPELVLLHHIAMPHILTLTLRNVRVHSAIPASSIDYCVNAVCPRIPNEWAAMHMILNCMVL